MTNERSKNSSLSNEPTRSVRVPVSMIPEILDFVRRGGEIPLFSETVPAGFPSPAEGTDYEGLDIVARLVPRPENVFFMRCPDDALESLGLFCGDLLIVRLDLTPVTGDIMVVENEGERHLQRFAPRMKQYETLLGVVRWAIHKP